MSDENFQKTSKRTIHVCLSPEKFKLLEEYSKKNSMLNCNQALENLIRKATNS